MRSTEMPTDAWHKFIDYNDIPEKQTPLLFSLSFIHQFKWESHSLHPENQK